MASGRAAMVRRSESEADGRLALLSDAQLLGRYVAERDADAFALVMARHGPRVLRVCRQVLGPTPDAEDAFQSTFLLLAGKAGSIRKGDSLGPWLHGAAHRIAVRLRVRAAQRRVREAKAHRREDTPGEADVELEDLRRAVHEEIDRLPARLREPILLCYLEARTNEEAARLLRCPASTVKERLSRGREVLRGRLSRRGLALGPLLLLLLLPGRATAEPVPAGLVRATLAAVRLRAGRRGGGAAGSPAGAPPRLAVVAMTASAVLVTGVAMLLALPPPRRGTWLAWMIEAARRACH